MSLREVSGSLLPEGIHSTLNVVTIQFETDFYITKSGFAIDFSSKRSPPKMTTPSHLTPPCGFTGTIFGNGPYVVHTSSVRFGFNSVLISGLRAPDVFISSGVRLKYRSFYFISSRARLIGLKFCS